MDPNQTLKDLRAMVAQVVTAGGTSEGLRELAEAFDALDGWLSRGGALPQGWQNPARAGKEDPPRGKSSFTKEDVHALNYGMKASPERVLPKSSKLP